MHESLDRDNPQRQFQHAKSDTVLKPRLSFRRGEEAFRARGEGLWGNEATGEADQILLSVQDCGGLTR